MEIDISFFQAKEIIVLVEIISHMYVYNLTLVYSHLHVNNFWNSD